MQVHFLFDDFLGEIEHLRNMAEDLLDYDAPIVLKQAQSKLNTIRGKYAAQRGFDWEIREDQPLRTIVSKGQYEPAHRIGNHHVQAEISFKWRIRPLSPAKKKKKKKDQLNDKEDQSEVFTLTGLASVKVKFYECCKKTCNRQDPLGSFRLEVGMPDQPDGPLGQLQPVTSFPGCFFHAQILGENDNFPFPRSFTIPRLPSIIFTPIAVAEYVLGELFQSAWSDHNRHGTYDAIELAKIQRKRFKAMLSWQTSVLNQSNRNSPWLLLKRAHPETLTFVAED
jgi:hypothetical protein